LLHHFGTLKAIERASVSDLARAPGISAETARKIYDFFHESGGAEERALPTANPPALAAREDLR
jgi:ERCC4-type nuclease